MFDANTQSETKQALQQLLDKLDVCRHEIIKRIENAEEMTTPEVLAAGSQVNKIVEIVRAHEKGRDEFVQQTFDELLTIMGEYSEKAGKTLEEQSKSIEVATSMTKDIIQAGTNIDSLASSARLLTINAKILAASMTSQGTEVSTLAGEMKSLSDEISNNNKEVRQLTSTLLSTLPAIDKTSLRIGDAITETRAKMVSVERQAAESYQEIVTESKETLEQISESAYNALSHLQFHDPVVQRLKSIDTFVYNLIKETAIDIGDERNISSPMLGHEYVGNMTEYEEEDAEDAEDARLEAGEPILF